MKNRLKLLLIFIALVPTLAACTACDCPRAVPSSTTVVTPPPGHTTVVEPAD